MTDILVTSGFDFEGYEIIEYLGHWTGECVLGTGFISNLEASISDTLGIESTYYKEKLTKAKDSAMLHLEEQALACGANAIIGLDVDYTMFTSNMIGVIANGTAVRIRKIDPDYFNTCCTLPIGNYHPDVPIRFLNLIIKEHDYIQICFVTMGECQITALDMDITLHTYFEDSITFQGIRFMKMKSSENLCFTENYAITVPCTVLEQFKSASVQVKKFIQAGHVFSPQISDQPILLQESELKELRDAYGSDVVRTYAEGPTSWFCLCGKENALNTSVCELCGRSQKIINAKTQKEIYEKLLGQAQRKQSVREIWTLFHDHQTEHCDLSDTILIIVKECETAERMYGNQKDACIRKLKEEIEKIL